MFSKRILILIFIVVVAVTALPVVLAQNTPPAAPTNINVNPNQGRPTVSWDDDSNAGYYYLVISTSDNKTILFDMWLAKVSGTNLPRITCSGGACEYDPDVNPVSGSYAAWLQSWGNGSFSVGGLRDSGWNTSGVFNISTEKPGSPVVNLTGTDTGKVTVGWQGSNNATWYHIWLGTSQTSIPSHSTKYFKWHLAKELGCASGLVQTCTLPETLNLSNGDYEVWMQVWGPAGFSIEANKNWYQAATFSVSNSNVDPDDDNGGGELSEIEAQVIALLNADRKKMGMGCLAHNTDLWEAARRHNIDMRDNNFFEHKGSDGSSFVKRSQDAGYTGIPTGENIAVGYSTAQKVYNGWFNSSGHYANMFNQNANEIGISLIEGGSWGKYWTMVLGRSNNVSGACN